MRYFSKLEIGNAKAAVASPKCSETHIALHILKIYLNEAI